MKTKWMLWSPVWADIFACVLAVQNYSWNVFWFLYLQGNIRANCEIVFLMLEQHRKLGSWVQFEVLIRKHIYQKKFENKGMTKAL